MSTTYTAHVFTKNRIVYLKSEDAQALDDVLAIVNMHDALTTALRDLLIAVEKSGAGYTHIPSALRERCRKAHAKAVGISE